MRREPRVRLVLASLILGLQVAAIAAAPFLPRLRYLAWAPFHEPATYRISVRIEDRELSQNQITRRYGLPGIHRKPGSPEDWQLNDIRNVLDLIQAYESTTGRRDRAEVRVEYRRNGGKPEVWRWPPAP